MPNAKPNDIDLAGLREQTVGSIEAGVMFVKITNKRMLSILALAEIGRAAEAKAKDIIEAFDDLDMQGAERKARELLACLARKDGGK